MFIAMTLWMLLHRMLLIWGVACISNRWMIFGFCYILCWCRCCRCCCWCYCLSVPCFISIYCIFNGMYLMFQSIENSLWVYMYACRRHIFKPPPHAKFMQFQLISGYCTLENWNGAHIHAHAHSRCSQE